MRSGYLAGRQVQGAGGAIYNAGLMRLSDVVITDNRARAGGGIFNTGELELESAQVSHNAATHYGGGGILHQNLTATRSSLTISATSIISNTAKREGGAISFRAMNGALRLTNSTLSGNSAARGGGLFAGEGESSLTHTTLYGNHAPAADGGNIARSDNTSDALVLANSLLVNGSCQGTIRDGGGNLREQAAGCIIGNEGLVGLGSLQHNGGSTLTHALAAHSAARDAALAAHCLLTDQRAVARPQGAGCDSGAFEYEPPPSAPLPYHIYLPQIVHLAAAAGSLPGLFRLTITKECSYV